MAPREPIFRYVIEPLEHDTKPDISALDSWQNLLNNLIVKCFFPGQADPNSLIDVSINFIDNADEKGETSTTASQTAISQSRSSAAEYKTPLLLLSVSLQSLEHGQKFIGKTLCRFVDVYSTDKE